MFFLNNYWGNERENSLVLNQIMDHKDHAHFEIRRGNNVKADEILRGIDPHTLSLREQGYYYFYKGLASEDNDLFYKSIEIFKKIEDKFFSKMDRKELYLRGERPATIEAAYS
jgi:hypothetical protein